MAEQLTGEVTELLQELIRNQCVNDGSPESGDEERNATLLRDYLEGTGLDFTSFESLPGRRSLVARIEGSDPAAPSLCLMGHTDVVPVTASGWSRDPFGGELVDGEVWGRGAIDMLNLTASMAVATKHLARTGFRPKGTLLRKTHRQLYWSVIQPPRVGPTTGAIRAARPNSVIAMPCFSRGKLSSSTPWLEGCRPPPASPCTTRKKISCSRLVAIPHSPDEIVTIAMEIRK